MFQSAEPCLTCSPLTLLLPTWMLPQAQLHLCSLHCAAEKRPLRAPDLHTALLEVPPSLQPTSISLKHIHTLSLAHCIQAKPEATYSSTLVMLRCFLYHVCQWAISLRAFWLQPLHGKKRSLFVSLVLDRQLRATLTTFTHTDSELNINWNRSFTLAVSNCCILARGTYFLQPCFSQSGIFTYVLVHILGKWHGDTYVINLSTHFSERKGFPQQLYWNL